MRTLRTLPVLLALGVMPLAAFAQQPATSSKAEIVDRIIAQERAEVQSLRQYSPLVETYIQNLRPDKQHRAVLDTDKYVLTRAHLANGIELEQLTHRPATSRESFTT